MTAGIQVITPDGHIQISSDMEIFHLHSKGVLDLSGWSQWGSTGSYRDVTISGVASGRVPMMALSSASATWCRLESRTSTSVTYRVFRASTGASNVTWYLFQNGAVPDSGLFSVYNSAGVCVFNANHPPCRPIGRYETGTYTGLSRTGRSCAFVPQKQRTYQHSTYSIGGLGSCQSGGQPGYQVYLTTGWAMSAIVCNGATLSDTNITMTQGPVPYMCNQSPTTPGSSAGASNELAALILDVTNY